MLNIVWPIFLILSVFYAILSGNLNTLNQSIFESTNTAIQLSITLLGTMCLWSGIMKIASETSAINKITDFLAPFMKFLFPKIKKGDKIKTRKQGALFPCLNNMYKGSENYEYNG